MQWDPRSLHGGELVVLRKRTKSKDGRQQNGEGEHLVHQGGDEIKNELSDDDNTETLSCQIVYKEPYSLKNEYDDQNKERAKEIVQESG